jgi:hypothetical protein
LVYYGALACHVYDSELVLGQFHIKDAERQL